MIRNVPNRTIIRFEVKERDMDKLQSPKTKSKKLSEVVLRRVKKTDQWPEGMTVVNAKIYRNELVVVLE